jgi:hypothetical protein
VRFNLEILSCVTLLIILKLKSIPNIVWRILKNAKEMAKPKFLEKEFVIYLSVL